MELGADSPRLPPVVGDFVTPQACAAGGGQSRRVSSKILLTMGTVLSKGWVLDWCVFDPQSTNVPEQ